MTLGLALTAFGLGLRHGVDWDHIAAIADLTGSSSDRRRGFVLSLWYAVGHAAVVFALGAALMLASVSIPDSVDDVMGRVVGATLVLLGVWVLADLWRGGPEVRLRSRWMLVLDGTYAGLRRVRQWGGRRTIAVTHDHPHEHDPDLAHDEVDDPAHVPAHDHAHDRSEVSVAEAEAEPALVGGGRGGGAMGRVLRHRHGHRHQLELATDGADAGAGVAVGVGLLHGVGIESPTQIAVFVGAQSVADDGAGLLLLTAWVAGLVVANAGLAAAAGRGLLQPSRRWLQRVMAVLVAGSSFALGTWYLVG